MFGQDPMGIFQPGKRPGNARYALLLVCAFLSFVLYARYQALSKVALGSQIATRVAGVSILTGKARATELGGDSNVQHKGTQQGEAQRILSSRVCGSPAVDGYAHVDPACLMDSPTAQWWQTHIISTNRYDDLVTHLEPHADYDGLAVFWGINNKKNSAEECAQQCRDHRPGVIPGPMKNLPCNAFAWCGEDVCFEPDAHRHTRGDCWLKFTEGPASPEVNMRGAFPQNYRQRHPTAPEVVQWHAGVLLPPGVERTNGTWSPRWYW